ncbi:MAG: hypothetical protein Q9160_002992 [Pyrenula sp. 1 TL-2023]
MPEAMDLPENANFQKCPPEVLHLICDILSPKEVKEVRLACRSLAAVASQYFVPTVTFNSSSESLERLKKIAHHPLFSQYVVNLVYEAHLLPKVHNSQCYKSMLLSNKMRTVNEPEPPPDDASAREFRLYQRTMNKFATECGLSKTQLDMQYTKYKVMRDSQQQLLENKEDKEVLLDALPRFPRLKSIKFDNLGRCRHVLSQRYCDQFKGIDGFPPPGDPANVRVVPQVLHLLKAMCKSKAALKSFDLGAVSPQLFAKLKSAGRELLKKKLTKFESITLSFKADQEIADLLHELVPENAYELFDEKDYLRDFLASNRDLEDLQISFLDCPMHIALKMANVMGTHHWPKLQSLSLMSINTTDNDLLAFLRRHSSTLSIVRFGFTVLTKGNWPDTIDEIQELFWGSCITTFKFWGYLLTKSPSETVDLSFVDPDNPDFYDPRDMMTLGTAIDYYICEKEPHDDMSLNPLHRMEDFLDPLEYSMGMLEDWSSYSSHDPHNPHDPNYH